MKNKIIILMTIFSIMFITVAWASFSTILTISGEATILTDSTPPVCGAWKLRPSTLTYAEATAQDAFIDPGTNNTWTDDSLILSVDCTDNTGCQADHYDVKTYDSTTKTDTSVLTQVIKDLYNNETTCTLPLGASNPYVDKDAPIISVMNVFPEDGEFKVTVSMEDTSSYPAFENIDGAYYTYEGNSFRGTSLNNMIIATNIIGRAQYATQDTSTGTDANGYPIFESMPATTMASSYCTGCRLPTYNEIGYVEDSVEVVEGYPYTNSGYEYTEYSYFLTPAHINKMGTYSVDIVVGYSLSDLYISGTMVTNEAGIRPVVDIPTGLTMTGSGTQADPYVIMSANSGFAASGVVSAQFYYKKCGDANWTALTKNTFAAKDTKTYNNWYIPSNGETSTSCLSSAWGTYYFKVDTEDAVGNIKTYYSKKTTNSTYPVEGYTENENEMNQFALAPLKAKNISYDNTGQPTLCTNVECIYDQLRYMFGLGLSYGITLDNRSATASGTETIYENYGDGFYLTNTSGTLSNKMTTSTNAITVPTKTGYIFDGYYTETNGGGTQYINASGNLTASATASLRRTNRLYANWNEIILTFSDQTITKNYSTSSQTANVTAASGGISTYTYSKVSGESDITVSSAGVITIPAGKTANTDGYTVVVRATDDGSGATKDATYTIMINKVANTMTVTSSQNLSTAINSKNNVIVNYTAPSNANGAVTYSLKSRTDSSGNKISSITYYSSSARLYIYYSSALPGTYTVVITATAAGDANHYSKSSDITLTVTITKTPFVNTLDKFYLYEGKRFIGTGYNNYIISEYLISYMVEYPTALSQATAYCTGCGLLPYNAAGTFTNNTAYGKGYYNGDLTNHKRWWIEEINGYYYVITLKNGKPGIYSLYNYDPTTPDGTNYYGCRPAADIPSTAKLTSGNGTSESPYVITVSQ